jgi:hypothetical protein
MAPNHFHARIFGWRIKTLVGERRKAYLQEKSMQSLQFDGPVSLSVYL